MIIAVFFGASSGECCCSTNSESLCVFLGAIQVPAASLARPGRIGNYCPKNDAGARLSLDDRNKTAPAGNKSPADSMELL